MKIERILLTTDFSNCARQAYEPAVELARRLGAHLCLVHFKDHPVQYSPPGFFLDPRSLEAVDRAQEDQMKSEAAEKVFQGLAVSTHLLHGEPMEAIVSFARQERCDLIVQASHGRSGWKRFVLGSFAERILRAAPVPVLTVKGMPGLPPAGRGLEPRRILFPYDFSGESRKALEPLRFLAGVYGSTVLVLYVWRNVADLLPIYGAGGEAIDVELLSVDDDYLERLRKDLKEFAEAELRGVPHEGEVTVGDPATVIMEKLAGAKADLVCMATHGWTGLKRAMLGSVAEKVLRGTSCPTLTVLAGQAPGD
jgi:nucleotide-binding universal stress UspA family protein